jgi:hypothetical protein
MPQPKDYEIILVHTVSIAARRERYVPVWWLVHEWRFTDVLTTDLT